MEEPKGLVKIDNLGEVPSAKKTSLLALVDRFIGSQDGSKPSRATYSWQLKQLTSWLRESGRVEALSSLQRQDILAYREHLLGLGKSANTVAGYLTSVRKFFEWLETERIYPNIARGVKGTRKAKGFRKDCLTPGQIREALASIDRGSLEGPRDYALFNLLVRTGIRTIEVVRAQVGDLRQQGGEAVVWVQGKGRDAKDDFVILIDKALGRLKMDNLEAVFKEDRDRNYVGGRLFEIKRLRCWFPLIALAGNLIIRIILKGIPARRHTF